MASDTLLRVSGLAELEVGDIDFGTGTVTVRRSKTDQEGEGAVLYLDRPTLKRVWKWLEASELEGGSLFQRVRIGGVVGESALSHQAIRAIIKSRAEAVGIEGQVSGHSLRVRTAQSLAAADASLVEMQRAGRWQSPTMPGHHARAELASSPEESDLGAVARLRCRK